MKYDRLYMEFSQVSQHPAVVLSILAMLYVSLENSPFCTRVQDAIEGSLLHDTGLVISFFEVCFISDLSAITSRIFDG